ncbi:MAG: MerR family transcriptional regulator [Clostridia bacterium]|nr:MerR family transcriptional regulator [Clostridia bacterium]
MRKNDIMWYKISEFGKLTGLSAKTLRFYDQKGVLSPKKQDENNGYRYYNVEQVFDVSKIRQLKKIGFSLQEIKNYIMLDASIDKQILMLEERKKTINTELAICRMKKENNIDVILKNEPPICCYCKSIFVEDYKELMSQYYQMINEALMSGVQFSYPYNCIIEYLSDEFCLKNISVNMYLEVAKTPHESIIELPSRNVLSSICHGIGRLSEVYAAIYRYSSTYGYTVSGYPIEKYIFAPLGTAESEMIIEVCFPVTQKAD